MFFGTPSINSYKDKIWVISEMPYFCKLQFQKSLSELHVNCWHVVKVYKYLSLWKIPLNYLSSLILFPVQEFGVYLSFFALLAVPCFKTQRFLFFVMFTLVSQNEKYLTLFAFTRGCVSFRINHTCFQSPFVKENVQPVA